MLSVSHGRTTSRWATGLTLGLALLLCLALVVPASATIAATRTDVAYLIAHTIGGFDSFVPPATPTYPDVPTENPCYAEVEYAKARLIMTGFADGCFHPMATVSRGQAAAYVAREKAGGEASVPPGPARSSFPDISVYSPYFRYVEYDLAQGVFAGVLPTDGLFHPSDLLDIREACTWWGNASGISIDPTTIPGVVIGKGAVQGTVLNLPDSQPLPGAAVSLSGQGSLYQATSDLGGSFLFSDLEPGTYTASASLAGYKLLGARSVWANPQRVSSVLLYMEPENWFEDSDYQIYYCGYWWGWTRYYDGLATAGQYRAAYNASDIACFSWEGTGVTWHAVTGPNMGRAKLCLDGTDWERVVNLYSATPGTVTLTKKDLPSGSHYLTITALGEADPRSAGTLVTVDAFEVIP